MSMTAPVSKQKLIQNYEALRPVFLKLCVVMNPKQKLSKLEKEIFLDQCARCEAVISKLKPLLSNDNAKEKAQAAQLTAVEGAIKRAKETFLPKEEVSSSSAEDESLLGELSNTALEQQSDSAAEVLQSLFEVAERVKKASASALTTGAAKPPSPPAKPLAPLPPTPPTIKLLDALVLQYRHSESPLKFKMVYMTPPYRRVPNTPENQAKLRQDDIEFEVRGSALLIPYKYRDTIFLSSEDCAELGEINRHLRSQFAIRARAPREQLHPAGGDTWIDMFDSFRDESAKIFRSDEPDLVKIEKLTKSMAAVKEILIFSDQYPGFKIADAVEHYVMLLDGLNRLKRRSFE